MRNSKGSLNYSPKRKLLLILKADTIRRQLNLIILKLIIYWQFYIALGGLCYFKKSFMFTIFWTWTAFVRSFINTVVLYLRFVIQILFVFIKCCLYSSNRIFFKTIQKPKVSAGKNIYSTNLFAYFERKGQTAHYY